MDSRLLPQPDSDLGYSESQLVGILGERVDEFHEYMLMRASAFAEDGTAVYFPGDVRRFVEHYVPPRARRLTEQEIEELVHKRRPELEDDAVGD